LGHYGYDPYKKEVTKEEIVGVFSQYYPPQKSLAVLFTLYDGNSNNKTRNPGVLVSYRYLKFPERLKLERIDVKFANGSLIISPNPAVNFSIQSETKGPFGIRLYEDVLRIFRLQYENSGSSFPIGILELSLPMDLNPSDKVLKKVEEIESLKKI